MARTFARSLKRHAWSLTAAAAALLLLGLALYSPDRQKGLAEYQAAGPMRHIATADIVALRIEAGAKQWRFERNATGWQLADGGTAVSTATSGALEMGLRLLHNTPPERSFDTVSPEFGLDPPALQVRLQATDGQIFEAEFGSANPIGMARYTRIRSAGQSMLELMPDYVAQAWEQAVASR